MNNMEKTLRVNNLKISFRTTGGTVKAVRDISFDLEKGKTLAIVGESGSGKSVTSKAILGILAGNSIVEGGEILYDGKDLLKISEEEMCKIRGDRISMIFQDPLSSLNPIVKIGKQITEAMLLKSKTGRKAAKRDFNNMLLCLKENMLAALGDGKKADIEKAMETFDKFCTEANKWENNYNIAYAAATALLSEIEDLLFLSEKKQKFDGKGRLKEMANRMQRVKDPFLTKGMDDKISALAVSLKEESGKAGNGEGGGFSDNVPVLFAACKEVLTGVTEGTRPNFFRIGYYKMENPEADIASMDTDALNALTMTYLDEHFMKDFLTMTEAALVHAYDTALAGKKEALTALAQAKTFFSGKEAEKADALKQVKAVADVVEAAIDRTDFVKDSKSYTFRTSLTGAVEKYYTAKVRNPKEEARFAAQSEKREALIAKGKTVDWKVVPALVFDLDVLRCEIVGVLDAMTAHYTALTTHETRPDFAEKAEQLVNYFKDKASQVVYEVTREMAREKAISLMEEVGIPEPRIRYNQYPFEFSGGMRQRIVIAIALAANPEVLICDEPTTALDVTIQAQILELINRLKEERQLSVIFITHDLGVVANMADDIAVMYAGKIVEYGTADEIFYDPRHPYTWALLSSMPDLDTTEKLDAIPGTPPNMIYPPVGDAFADRNKYAMEIDFERQPPAFPVSDTHWAATWLLHPAAPHVDPPKIITDRIERMKKAGAN